MASVVTTVSTTIAVPREALFPWLVPGVFYDELHTVLRDAAAMPGVERTSGTTGPWDVPGSYRIVHTTDGQAAREEVTGARAPDYFSYRVNEFTSPLIRRLVREARGQWWFAADGANTRATWEYAFDATSPLAMPLLVPMVRVLWHRYMQNALKNVRERAEREIVPSRPGVWSFDLTALHGEQGMSDEDRGYHGSRFAEVRDALRANPYRGGDHGEAPGPLPMFKSTIGNAWKGASIRSLDSHADLRWGADGKGFRRILSPNGIGVLGRWEITADSAAAR